MAKKVYGSFSTKTTPQSKPVPGLDQVKNAAGGYAFKLSDPKRLERFLILGTEGGTYYVGELELTRENAECVARCLATDPKGTIDMIAEISDQGRAISNSPALFALAMATSTDFVKSPEDRRYAWSKLSTVARIGTHNFEFAGYREQFGGWGTMAREHESAWYNDMPLGKLAYQAVKYQSRYGWSHGDILRLAHPKPQDNLRDWLYKWIVGRKDPYPANEDGVIPDLMIIWAFEQVKKAETAKEIVKLIEEYGLPREAIPTEWLNDESVWEALLMSGKGMPLTAMIRNLGKMTSIGLLHTNLDNSVKFVADRLGDADYIKHSRVHPMTLLIAQAVYEQGHGERGHLSWSPVGRIVDSLDASFYDAFANVTPAGKPICIAIDGSGSMTWPVHGGRYKDRSGRWSHSEGPMSCRRAAVAMALVTANVEPNYEIIGYTDGRNVKTVSISPKQRLRDAMETFQRLVQPQGTDCALPYIFAREQNIEVDAFVTYTDNETWAGKIHPFQALDTYRSKFGQHVKAIMVGMTATGYRLTNPSDQRALEVAGFDTTTPQAISEFLSA